MDIWFIGGLIIGFTFIGGYVSNIVGQVTNSVGLATYSYPAQQTRSNRVRYLRAHRVRYYT